MKQKIKIIIDIAMTAAMPILMAYSLIGEALHEWLGISIFALFIIHHALNFHWYKNLTKGKYTGVRLVNTAVNILLTVIMFLLTISGIIMSKHVLISVTLSGAMHFARTTHLLCSYWSFALMSLHLGMHIDFIFGKAMKNAGKSIRKLLFLLVSAVSIFGITAFVRCDLWEYMTLKTQFVFFDTEKPLYLFFAEYVSIMILFAQVGFYIKKLLRYIKKG